MSFTKGFKILGSVVLVVILAGLYLSSDQQDSKTASSPSSSNDSGNAAYSNIK